MHTFLNSTDSIANRTRNDNDDMVFVQSSLSSTLDNFSSIFVIFILSVLCFFGVIFMIFGPMMRSEAWKRVDNYIFGQDTEHENRDDGGTEDADV
jgi:heme/copper-type cytochrome/quinol oxidase subunit 3